MSAAERVAYDHATCNNLTCPLPRAIAGAASQSFRGDDLISRQRKPFAFLLFALVNAFCSLAQNSLDKPAVTIRNAVRMVEVDVIARDKRGNAVTDLQTKDFQLFDNGRPQAVTHISVERPAFRSDSGAPDASLKTAPATSFSNTRTTFDATTVILFDVLNTSSENQVTMRTELLKSLSRMPAGTRVALLVLGENLSVISDFSESVVSLKKAAENQFHLRAEGFGPSIKADATGNPKLDQMILNAVTRAFRGEEQDRSTRTLAALNVICDELARIPGRKSLVWLTSGITVAGESQDVKAEIDRFNDANIAVYTIDARGVLLSSDVKADTDFNDMTEPIKTEQEESRADLLAILARSTGGVFYHNTNRLGQAVNQALDDRGIVYVIDYYPNHDKWNGELHKLEVRTSRPGLRLRYRESYRATPVQPMPSQTQQQMLAAVASASLDFPGIRFTAEPRGNKGNDPFVLLHVPAAELEMTSKAGKMAGELEIWCLQKRSSGEDLYNTHWKSDLQLSPDQYQAALHDGVALAGAFTLNPAAAKVRIIVRDITSGKIGSLDIPVEAFSSAAKP